MKLTHYQSQSQQKIQLRICLSEISRMVHIGEWVGILYADFRVYQQLCNVPCGVSGYKACGVGWLGTCGHFGERFQMYLKAFSRNPNKNLGGLKLLVILSSVTRSWYLYIFVGSEAWHWKKDSNSMKSRISKLQDHLFFWQRTNSQCSFLTAKYRWIFCSSETTATDGKGDKQKTQKTEKNGSRATTAPGQRCKDDQEMAVKYDQLLPRIEAEIKGAKQMFMGESMQICGCWIKNWIYHTIAYMIL